MVNELMQMYARNEPRKKLFLLFPNSCFSKPPFKPLISAEVFKEKRGGGGIGFSLYKNRFAPAGTKNSPPPLRETWVVYIACPTSGRESFFSTDRSPALLPFGFALNTLATQSRPKISSNVQIC